MMPLDQQDVVRVLTTLPACITDELGEHVFLAGGYIRSVICHERPADIDLFTSAGAWGDSLRDTLVGNGYRQSSCTDNAFTLVKDGSVPVQIIRRWHEPACHNVVMKFDLTVAAAALTRDVGVCHSRFYQDIAAKRLTYTKPTDAEPGGTILRLMKYARKGFHVPPETIAAVMDAFSRKFPAATSYDVIVRHLREVDPLSARERAFGAT